MGTDRIEFGQRELRVIGGDYGQLTLEGTTQEAQRALDEIVAANRRSGGRNVVCYFIAEFDDTPDLFEDRDAGREGTPDRGVGPDSTNVEGGIEGGSGDRPAPRPE